GAGAERAPHVLSVSVPGASAGSLLVSLDLERLAVSSASACSSGALTPSHVLTAMGVPEEIAGPSVRFSLGRETTARDVERAAEAFPRVVERLRTLAGA